MNFYNITYFLIKNNSSNNYRSQNIFQNSLREMESNRKSAYTCSTRCFPPVSASLHSLPRFYIYVLDNFA